MSTVNQFYTFNYSQPKDYHFSHDSVFLAQIVFEFIKNNPQIKFSSMADVCAGCGIIGMDLLFHLNKNNLNLPVINDFIEVQNIYENDFVDNIIKLNGVVSKKADLQFINKNYADLSSDENFKSKYDLIVCNPPYFKMGQGKLSPSDFKNRCRFYIDSDFSNLIKFIQYSLAPKGMAFVLVKELKDHKLDFGVLSLCEQFELSVEKFADVRGTDVFRIFK